MAPIKVFLSYAHEDRAAVRKLYLDLRSAGFTPWLDEEDILPGQDWELEIRRSMKDSDFCILCLSQTSVAKRGYIQREMKRALDLLDEFPEGSIYLVPARIDNCPVPESLTRRQWVDLFHPGGLNKLIKALQFEVARRNRQRVPPRQASTQFSDIGFSVDSKVKESVERLQFTVNQLEPYLRLISDTQHELTAAISKLGPLSNQWRGKVSEAELLRRLEATQQIVDLAIAVVEGTTPVSTFLGYCSLLGGIGPGNVDEARQNFNTMAVGTPAIIGRTTDLLNALQRATWLPSEVAYSLVCATDQIRNQASLLQKDLSTFGRT